MKSKSKSKSKQKGGIGGMLALAAGGLVALYGGSVLAKGIEDTKDKPSGGGSGSGKSDPWTPGPGGKGRVYGSKGGGSDNPGLPADFNFDGMDLWIAPDCSAVVIGERFYPQGDEVVAIEPQEWSEYVGGREFEAVVAVDPTNSIGGLWDWGMSNDIPAAPEGFVSWVTDHLSAANRPRPSQSALDLAALLLEQVSPECLANSSTWGPGVVAWLEDHLLQTDLFLHEWWGDDINFDPELEEILEG